METNTYKVTQAITNVDTIKNTEELLTILEGTNYTGHINDDPNTPLRGIIHPKGKSDNDPGRRLLTNNNAIMVTNGQYVNVILKSHKFQATS